MPNHYISANGFDWEKYKADLSTLSGLRADSIEFLVNCIAAEHAKFIDLVLTASDEKRIQSAFSERWAHLLKQHFWVEKMLKTISQIKRREVELEIARARLRRYLSSRADVVEAEAMKRNIQSRSPEGVRYNRVETGDPESDALQAEMQHDMEVFNERMREINRLHVQFADGVMERAASEMKTTNTVSDIIALRAARAAQRAISKGLQNILIARLQYYGSKLIRWIWKRFLRLFLSFVLLTYLLGKLLNVIVFSSVTIKLLGFVVTIPDWSFPIAVSFVGYMLKTHVLGPRVDKFIAAEEQNNMIRTADALHLGTYMALLNILPNLSYFMPDIGHAPDEKAKLEIILRLILEVDVDRTTSTSPSPSAVPAAGT